MMVSVVAAGVCLWLLASMPTATAQNPDPPLPTVTTYTGGTTPTGTKTTATTHKSGSLIDGSKSVPHQTSHITTTKTIPAITPTASPTMGAGSPNIVVILTDDQDLHLGSLEHMPNLQSMLVEQGMFFEKHYAHVSLCCPSRATIWTGKHAHNTNVTSVEDALPGGAWRQVVHNGFNKDYLASWMQEAGYNTYYSGKLFNGYGVDNYCEPECLHGWTTGDLLTDPTMYRYYNSSYTHTERNVWYPPVKSNGYSTDQISDFLLGYIDDAIADQKPFLAVGAPVASHIQGGMTYKDVGKGDNHTSWPYPVAKFEYMDMFQNITFPRTANFNPSNQSGVAGVWGLYQLTDANVKMQEEYYRIRAQTLASVDDMVAAVVNYLDEKGILDNTYIIYTSDNGFHLANHRLQPGKEQCFEEDINVPFIIRGPGVGKNMTTNLVTGHIDLAPTILAIANGSLDTHNLDGTPITFPLESNADFERNEAARGEFTHVEFWGPFHQEGMQGGIGVDVDVNLQTYKALRMQNQGYNLMYSVWCQEDAHELYDMSWDPYQMTNLHPNAPINASGTNAYKAGMDYLLGRPITEVISRLDALVLVLKTCSGDTCRHPWQQLHPGANVTSLTDALSEEYDGFYANSYAHAPVGWLQCYTGYSKKHSATLYDLANEMPLWINNGIKQMVLSGDAGRRVAGLWDAVWRWGLLSSVVLALL